MPSEQKYQQDQLLAGSTEISSEEGQVLKLSQEGSREEEESRDSGKVYLIKRRPGSIEEYLEEFDVDRLERSLQHHARGLNRRHIDPTFVAKHVAKTLEPQLKLDKFVQYVAELTSTLKDRHYGYGLLAGRVLMAHLHANTHHDYLNVCRQLVEYVHPKTKEPCPLIKSRLYEFVQEHCERIQQALGDYADDFTYEYTSVSSLMKSYLVQCDAKVVERPQHMMMRVACGIHCGDGGHEPDIDAAIRTYHLYRLKKIQSATPILAQMGLNMANLTSCFLLSFTDKTDSIRGIYDKLKECAIISSKGGGVGISVSDVRASGSYIRGSNGYSNGLVPMLRNFNSTARYVDQGGNKRKGAFALYLECWHRDIFAFLDLRKQNGEDEKRCRDIFLGMWVPDIFMRRVDADGDWVLMCPSVAKGLTTSHGKTFDALYESYEAQEPADSPHRIKARTLWYHMLRIMIESGQPYLLFKDACNGKSNQQHLGTIKCSNLCVEIVQYSDDNETACCNLGSVRLSAFVKGFHPHTGKPIYDYDGLHEVTEVQVENTNKMIDITSYYETDEYGRAPAKKSNLAHRPMGIGVMGYADALIQMHHDFAGEDAALWNEHVFETMYHGAVTASCRLAKKFGPHQSFPGSPMSKGLFQFDLWGKRPGSENSKDLAWRGRYDWAALAKEVVEHGVRNSLLLAAMPTASTSALNNASECFEPPSSNIYVRQMLAGSFICTQDALIDALDELNLWNDEMRELLIKHNGSVQGIMEIPEELRKLFKTSWDISQRVVIDMAARRGIYICQSQSMSLHMAKPTLQNLTAMLFYAWRAGLKTGMYYLRAQPPTYARKYTLSSDSRLKDQKSLPEKQETEPLPVCTMEAGCVSCAL